MENQVLRDISTKSAPINEVSPSQGWGEREDERVERVLEVMPLFQPQAYVDLGCGDCKITKALASRLQAQSFAGLDIYDQDQENYIKIDQKSIPLGDSSVDLITCFVSIHHFQNVMLKEISRILALGGFLVIREHDANPDMIAYLDGIHLMDALSRREWSVGQVSITQNENLSDQERTEKLYSSFQGLDIWSGYFSFNSISKTLTSLGFELIAKREYQGNNPQALYHACFRKVSEPGSYIALHREISDWSIMNKNIFSWLRNTTSKMKQMVCSKLFKTLEWDDEDKALFETCYKFGNDDQVIQTIILSGLLTKTKTTKAVVKSHQKQTDESLTMWFNALVGFVQPPNPYVELQRAEIMKQARKLYIEHCKQDFGIDEPEGTFNRFIMSQITLNHVVFQGQLDPVLPSMTFIDHSFFMSIYEVLEGGGELDEAQISFYQSRILASPLWRETEQCIPVCTNTSITTLEEYESECDKYLLAVQKFMSQLNPESDEYHSLYDHVNLALEFRASTQPVNNNFDELMGEIRSLCDPECRQIVQPKLINMIYDIMVFLYESIMTLDHEERGYQVAVEKQEDKVFLKLSEDSERLSIPLNRYQELRSRFENVISLKEASKEVKQLSFDKALWCLLRRYRTLVCDKEETFLNLQPSVFQALEDHLAPCIEGFSSPLDLTSEGKIASYCSIFSDLDPLFGSLGTFFGFGSPVDNVVFEINVPSDEMILFQAASMIKQTLIRAEESGRRIGFFIILPNLKSLGTDSVSLFESDTFMKSNFIIEAGKHSYVSQETSEKVISPVDTHIILLGTSKMSLNDPKRFEADILASFA